MPFSGGVFTCTNDPFAVINGTVNVTYRGALQKPLDWDMKKCSCIELQDSSGTALDPPAAMGALMNIFHLEKGRLNAAGTVSMRLPAGLEGADQAVLEYAFKIGGRLYLRVPQKNGDGVPLYIRLEGS